MTSYEIDKRRRDKLKQYGFCTGCGKNKARNGLVTCESCADKKNEIYQNKKLSSSCVWCGVKVTGEKVRCHVCEKKASITKKKTRSARKINGLCLDCGSVSINNMAYCEGCTKKRREAERDRFKNRRVKGLCTKCGVASEGYSLCVNCNETTLYRMSLASSL